jgi:hypothetical protein
MQWDARSVWSSGACIVVYRVRIVVQLHQSSSFTNLSTYKRISKYNLLFESLLSFFLKHTSAHSRTQTWSGLEVILNKTSTWRRNLATQMFLLHSHFPFCNLT